MKIYSKSWIVVLLHVLAFPSLAHCGVKVWVGATDNNWNTSTNWSPSGIPNTLTDTVKFNSGSVNCNMPTAALTVLRLYIEGTYTGLVSKSSGNLTVNATGKGVTISSGTLTLGSGALLVTSGTTNVSGGTLNFGSGGGTLSGAYTQSGGLVNCGSGTITFSSTFSQSGGTFNGNSSLAHGIILNNSFTQSGGTLNLYNTSTLTASGTVTFNNSALTFNASDSSTFILTASTALSVSNEPIIKFGKLQFKPASAVTCTVTSTGSTTIRVSGELQYTGAGNLTLNGDSINVTGNLRSTSTATGNTGTTIINIIGTANQRLIGQGVAATGHFIDIVINKPVGTLTLQSVISVRGNWILVAGTINPGTSNVVFFNRTTPTNVDMLNSNSEVMPFNRFGVNSGLITLTSDIVVNNHLGIASGGTLLANGRNITVAGDWMNGGGTFTPGTTPGTVTFTGSSFNKIYKTASTEIFANVTFNRPAGSVTLTTPVQVTGILTLTKGRIKALSTNYLLFGSAATLSGGGSGAYVHGNVRKIGTTAFIFPLGDTTLVDSVAWHPLSISAPATSCEFEAEYKPVVQTAGSALDAALQSVSTTEHWFLRRISGTATVTTSLRWNVNSQINNIGSLRVASWSGTQWSDLGQVSLTMNWPRGTITASSTTLFVSNVATLTTATSKVTPSYARLQETLDGGYYTVTNNSLYFQVTDDYNDVGATLTYRILNASNVNVAGTLVNSANNLPVTKYGNNLLRLDLYTSSGLLASGVYILEVTNEKNETQYLRFVMP